MEITKNGERLSTSKYVYNEDQQVVIIDEDNVEIVLLEDSSTIKAGWYSTITTGDSPTITTGDSPTIKAGGYSTIKAGRYSTIDAGWYSTIDASRYSTIDAGRSSTIKAGDSSIIKAGDSSIIDAGNSSTIKAEGKNIVAIRSDILTCLVLNNQTIQWCPYKIPGHLELKNSKWYKDGEEHIIADGILSKVITTKGNVRKVRNFNVDTKEYDSPSYLIEQDGQFAHGATIKEAKEDLVYKLLDRDVSEYSDYTLDTILSLDKMIVMYRSITGACSQGTRNFVEGIDKKDEYTIQEVIDMTENQYGGQTFKEFFTRNRGKQ